MSEELKHVKIAVARIWKNPHRDFQRNPINDKQVDKIVGSIGRTGFWDNVVVRPHPQIPGDYQLAYGHSRLEAVKKVKITEVTLPVRDLSDWDMYLAMVDENETQQAITPQIAFENIEAGIVILENAFRKIGRNGTLGEFNKVLPKVVLRSTTFQRGGEQSSFTQALNSFFDNEGIGRRFILETLPQGGVHGNVINEVLSSHYGEQRAEAARKEAENQRKEAEAQREKAEADQKEANRKRAAAETRNQKAEAERKEAKTKKAEEDAQRNKALAEEEQAEAEELQEAAKKAQKDAEEAEEKSHKAAVEAKRIGGRTIDAAILLRFETPSVMAKFSQVIGTFKIPKIHHHAAMEYAIKNHLTMHDMHKGIKEWWYEVGGQQARDFEEYAKQKAREKFEESIDGGDTKLFVGKLGETLSNLATKIKLFLPAAPFVPSHDKFRGLILRLETARDRINELLVILRPDDGGVTIDVEARISDGHGSAQTSSNGTKNLPSLR